MTTNAPETRAFILTLRPTGEVLWSGPYDLDMAQDIAERQQGQGLDSRYLTLEEAHQAAPAVEVGPYVVISEFSAGGGAYLVEDPKMLSTKWAFAGVYTARPAPALFETRREAEAALASWSRAMGPDDASEAGSSIPRIRAKARVLTADEAELLTN